MSPRRKKLSTADVIINKSILFIILCIIGTLTFIGYKTNLILGAIAMMFFMSVFNILVDVPGIKLWLENMINGRDWKWW